MSRRIRLATTALVFAAATTLPAIAASPAHADFDARVNYLTAQGHEGDEASAACQTGAEGDLQGCLGILIEWGVRPDVALQACVTANEEA